MWRRARQAAVVLSMLAAAFVIGLRIVSLGTPRWFRHEWASQEADAKRGWHISGFSISGRLYLRFTSSRWESNSKKTERDLLEMADVHAQARLGRARENDWARKAQDRGFWFGHDKYVHASGEVRTLALRVPHWFLALLLAAAPTVFVAKWLRRRRFPEGYCQRCGYDLRASPDCCPECGQAPIESQPVAP